MLIDLADKFFLSRNSRSRFFDKPARDPEGDILQVVAAGVAHALAPFHRPKPGVQPKDIADTPADIEDRLLHWVRRFRAMAAACQDDRIARHFRIGAAQLAGLAPEVAFRVFVVIENARSLLDECGCAFPYETLLLSGLAGATLAERHTVTH